MISWNKMIRLNYVPNLPEGVSVRTGYNVEKAVDRLRRALGLTIKYDLDKQYVVVVYKTSVGYEAALVEENIAVGLGIIKRRNPGSDLEKKISRGFEKNF